MRIALFLGHPAHFHMLKHAAVHLKKHGHQVFFVIKKKDILETLCQDAGFKYFKIREGRTGSKFGLIKSVLGMEYHMWQFIRQNKIDILVGSTLSFTAAKINRIHVLAMGEDDADVVPNYAKLVYPFASCVLTPNCCDNGEWNAKSAKYPGYHELAYLHPNHFTPDPEIVEAYGIDTSKPYFVMRFASLNAHHDSGIKGINTEIAQRLIDILENSGSACSLSDQLVPQTPTDPSQLVPLSTNSPTTNATSGNKPRIYITSERPLEPQFEKYRIKINPLDMHHVMAFASLYIGDSQTMAAEAGVLGVPFVRFNDFVGRIGYLRELEDTYELGYGIHASVLPADSPIRRNDGSPQPSGVEELYKRVETLVSMPSAERKATFAARREKMLSDKIDCAKFLTWFIENYPASAEETKKADEEFWERFK